MGISKFFPITNVNTYIVSGIQLGWDGKCYRNKGEGADNE
jgi:hypothetical protein